MKMLNYAEGGCLAKKNQSLKMFLLNSSYRLDGHTGKILGIQCKAKRGKQGRV